MVVGTIINTLGHHAVSKINAVIPIYGIDLINQLLLSWSESMVGFLFELVSSMPVEVG